MGNGIPVGAGNTPIISGRAVCVIFDGVLKIGEEMKSDLLKLLEKKNGVAVPEGPFTVEEVVTYYNRGTKPLSERQRGDAKPLEEIWEEMSLEALSNMFKPSQTDSGGSVRHFEKLIHELIDVLRSTKSIMDAATHLYGWFDGKRKKLRVTQIKRQALIAVKWEGGTIGDYYVELTRMFNQTIDDHNKKSERVKIANQDIKEELYKIRKNLAK